MTGGKLKLRKAYRGVVAAAQEEAALFGGTIEVDLCGRHPRVHLLLGGKVHIIPFAGTPRVADNGPTAIRQRIRQKAKLPCDSDRHAERENPEQSGGVEAKGCQSGGGAAGASPNPNLDQEGQQP